MNFFNVLTLIFVVARLLNLISWSWWIVFLPTILYVLIVTFVIVLGVAAELVDD